MNITTCADTLGLKFCWHGKLGFMSVHELADHGRDYVVQFPEDLVQDHFPLLSILVDAGLVCFQFGSWELYI